MLVREIIYLILSVRELECALCKKNLSLTPQILERAYQLFMFVARCAGNALCW